MSRPEEPDPPTSEEDEDEHALFRRAVADVRPLANDRADIRPPPPPPRPRPRDEDEPVGERPLPGGLPEPPCADPAAVEADGALLYCRPGVQQRVVRRLRRGRYTPGADLDLHGLTRREAHPRLDAFLAECRRRGIRCARIVHGKGQRSAEGGPVLKGAVDGWLRRREEVLAFASAPAAHGGTGAVYVLLRAPREA